jgi:hypothetical protein
VGEVEVRAEFLAHAAADELAHQSGESARKGVEELVPADVLPAGQAGPLLAAISCGRPL